MPVPENMNPFVSGQYLDWGMWQAVSESLFYLNLETGKLEPWLAESGEYSDDGDDRHGQAPRRREVGRRRRLHRR